MRKTFKYRLYPTKKQIETLEWTLDRARELYNAALQERRDAWNACKQHPNFYDPQWRKEQATRYSINFPYQCRQLTEIRNKIRPEYQLIGSHVLQNVLHRVDNAFKAFFRRVKNGEKAGYPRFQGKNRYDSFTFPDAAGWSLTYDNKLCLSKIGTLKMKLHRPLEGKIKTTTIKREGQHWYICFACEVGPTLRSPYTDDTVGIDLGLYHFAALSTGDIIDNPRYYRRAEHRLQQAQQSLSRKKKKNEKNGCKGNRRQKAIQRVARHHLKVRNQRRDFLHKQARMLVNTYETIVFEDLTPSNLSKRPKVKQDGETGQYLPNGASAKAGLNKSILDAGWSTFITMCEDKAASAGYVQVIRVDPRYTSQACSSCGIVVKKELSERWHSCDCGCELDRDVNAAKNILALGQREQGTHP